MGKIIPVNKFELWWRKAQGWFATQFASIKVNLTPVEEKIDDVRSDVADVKTAVENIDFSTLAKQGTDHTATLTAIKELLAGGGDPDIPEGVAERLAAIMQFFNISGTVPDYTALTPAEAIAIARDCQYNVMGTDWPIPTWLPTGVTEAQVESAAEGLGIPYHEPTQTA